MAEYLVIETEDGAPVARLVITQDRGAAFALGKALGHQYIGRIENRKFSEPLQRALDEYRELIDDQVLSLIDDALRRILEFGLVALMQPEGIRKRLRDFQLYNDGTALVALDE
jgi:hypothetical protein